MLSDLYSLEPDPQALGEVIMANLGEPIEIGNGLCVYSDGGDPPLTDENIQCENYEFFER